MSLLLPLFIPALLGLLVSRTLLENTKLPQKTFLSIVLAPSLGLGLCSILLFWCYVINPAAAQSSARLTATCLAFVLLAFRIYAGDGTLIKDAVSNFPERFRNSLRFLGNKKTDTGFIIKSIVTLASAALFLYYFVYFIKFYTIHSVFNAFGGWDARYFYKAKAGFFFRSPEHWREMFSTLIGPPDYPLLFPGAIAWGWNWLGHEALVWPVYLGLTFYASVLFLIVWYLASHTSWYAAFIAGAFFTILPGFRFWSTAQYADIPLAFFITSAALTFIVSLRQRDIRLFALAGLLAALSAWTKNEGLLFFFILSGVGSVTIFLFTDFSLREKAQALAWFAIGAFLPLATVLFMKYGLSGLGYYVGETDLFLTFRWSRIRLLFAFLINFKITYPEWSILWFFYLAALLAAGKDMRREYRWLFPAFIFLVELAYLAGYYVTPGAVLFHQDYGMIKTSLHRLMQHVAVLALIFSFESFYFFNASLREKISGITTAVFQLFLAGLIIMRLEAPKEPIIPEAWVSLMSGTEEKFVVPGRDLIAFKEFLPPRGRISYITDKPYAELNARQKEFFHDVKVVMAPLRVSQEPVYEAGILYTENDEIGEKRLRETGYEWVKKMAAGKGVIRKGAS